MDAYLNGQRLALRSQDVLGKGGEADIYRLPTGLCLKIFKPPDHPDYQGLPEEQLGATERLKVHQRKLPRLISQGQNFPPSVIMPQALATDRSQKKIIGYAMPLIDQAELLLRYSKKAFRQQGVDNEQLGQIFRNLRLVVQQVHDRQFVIGDFNDLNVLVKNTDVYFIDTDSWQFAEFFCRVFTQRFVDPLLCDPKAANLTLNQPYNPNSDWYAFAVMLLQSLLFVDPYGGIYQPADPKKRLSPGARPLHRITIFHPEVRYPKPAMPFSVLPDDLLHYFEQLFVHDQRGSFPENLLQLRWTTCSACGTEHARAVCPQCRTQAPAAIKEREIFHGTVTATRIFQTAGVIISAAIYEGKPYWLFHQNETYRRENQTVVASGPLDPHLRFRLQPRLTLAGKQNQLFIFKPGQPPETKVIDNYGQLPLFDANNQYYYWLANGELRHNGPYASEFLGTVLPHQSLFWVGPTFGFGFYRAANLQVGFVFNAEHRGLNDTVKLPKIRGQLVDATCCFTSSRCWFLYTTQESGQLLNHCLVLRADGEIEGYSETTTDDDTWLGTIRGKCCAGNFLLSATDHGIVRLEIQQGQIAVTKEFPDTESFLDRDSQLLAGADGVYVVTAKEIYRLQIR
ncbi:MAG: hypothetical protein V1846_01205 [Candidatus Komeilibacteria bacterium]